MRLNTHHALLVPSSTQDQETPTQQDHSTPSRPWPSHLLLVPYSAHHVPTYHAWMQDVALREATASEALSLEDEFAMQRSWREDRDKLTFIICSCSTSSFSDSGSASDSPLGSERVVKAGVDDKPESMVGDVNLFLFPLDEEEKEGGEDDKGDGQHPAVVDQTTPAQAQEPKRLVGELELMIAHPTDRRKGYGRAALLAFRTYIVERWREIYGEYFGPGEGSLHMDDTGREREDGLSGLAYLRVRINQENSGSIRLFESIGFVPTGEGANYFGEVELRWETGCASDKEDGEKVQILRYEAAV